MRKPLDMGALLNLSPAILLALGIAAEIAATLSLKLADGTSNPKYLAMSGLGYATSLLMLSMVLKQWSVGPVYAIWAGCGVAGVAVAGIFLFEDTIGLRELAGFLAVVCGVVLLSIGKP